MLRSCTIFLRNRLSAPQEKSRGVFAPRTFFGRRPKKMFIFAEGKGGGEGVSFLPQANFFRWAIFCEIFRQFHADFLCGYPFLGNEAQTHNGFLCSRVNKGFKGSKIQRKGCFNDSNGCRRAIAVECSRLSSASAGSRPKPGSKLLSTASFRWHALSS